MKLKKILKESEEAQVKKLTREQNEVSRAVTDKLTTIQKRIENDFFSDY